MIEFPTNWVGPLVGNLFLLGNTSSTVVVIRYDCRRISYFASMKQQCVTFSRTSFSSFKGGRPFFGRFQEREL